MAYVNATYENENHGTIIEVLEPTTDESDYDGLLRIQIEIDNFTNTDLKGLRDLGKWFLERADFIEQNFEKNGMRKTP